MKTAEIDRWHLFGLLNRFGINFGAFRRAQNFARCMNLRCYVTFSTSKKRRARCNLQYSLNTPQSTLPRRSSRYTAEEVALVTDWPCCAIVPLCNGLDRPQRTRGNSIDQQSGRKRTFSIINHARHCTISQLEKTRHSQPGTHTVRQIWT